MLIEDTNTSGCGKKVRKNNGATMNADDIAAVLRQKIPAATVQVKDTRGDGRHFTATVVTEAFQGLSRIQQHQMVYKALGACVGEEVHALQIVTRTPEDATSVRAAGG